MKVSQAPAPVRSAKMKMAQGLTTLLLLLAVSPSSSDRPPPRKKYGGGGVGSSSGAPQTLMHSEIEPKGTRRSHEVHRLPPDSFVVRGTSRTEARIIGGVFDWLEALYWDLVGLPAAPQDGNLASMPDGIHKHDWFEYAYNGMWAWSLWDQFDDDMSGYIEKAEITSRWSSHAMRAEFGSPMSSPRIADYNGYLECMAYTVVIFRKWDADKSGSLQMEELANSTLRRKPLVTDDEFGKWAVNGTDLYPDGFMALLWNNFAEDAPLSGESDAIAQGEAKAAADAAAAGANPDADGDSPDVQEDDISTDMGLWLQSIHALVDESHNGKIEAKEWYSATLQGKWADVLWHKLDSDGSGGISQHEFVVQMPTAMVHEFGGAPPAFGNHLNSYFSFVGLSILIFRRLDADKDGHLKWSEIENGPLERKSEKEGKPECGTYHVEFEGVINKAGFNWVAGGEGETLELEELVGMLAEFFSMSAKIKRS